MKKFFSLLFVFSSLTLSSCNKTEVTYSKIDNLDEYYTAEKVQAAKENFASSDKLTLSFKQAYTGMTYDAKWELDTNYMFEDSKQVVDVKEEKYTSIGKSLFLGSEVIEECRYYLVDIDSQTAYSGEDAVNKYNSAKNDVRNNVYNCFDDPTWFLSQFLGELKSSAETNYYVGSDKTIKITLTNKSSKLNSYVIVDINTLMLKKMYAKYNVPVSESESLSIVVSAYSSPTCSKHKTLKDIGWKEE